MAKSIIRFIVRFLSISLSVFLLSYFYLGTATFLISGLVIETIRRGTRRIIFGKKFIVSKHYIFWILFQTLFYYIFFEFLAGFSLNYLYWIGAMGLMISILNIILKFLGIEKILSSSFSASFGGGWEEVHDFPKWVNKKVSNIAAKHDPQPGRYYEVKIKGKHYKYKYRYGNHAVYPYEEWLYRRKR